MADLRKYASTDLAQSALWAVAFVGVAALVGLGKVKPETLEYMLFALVGRAAYTGAAKKGAEDERTGR